MATLQPGKIFRMQYSGPVGSADEDYMFLPTRAVRQIIALCGYAGMGLLATLLVEDLENVLTPEHMHALHVQAREGIVEIEPAPVEEFRTAWDRLKEFDYLQERRVRHDGAEYQFLSATELQGEFRVDLDAASDEELLVRMTS